MQSPDFGLLINNLIDRKAAETAGPIPCVVVAVDLPKSRCDVRPLISTLYQDGTFSERPIVLGVPIVWPTTSRSAMTFPISVGDTVMCIPAEANMDQFKVGIGQPFPPDDHRRNSEQDYIAVPGLAPFPKSVNNPVIRNWDHNVNDFVISHNISTGDEVEIRLTQSGDIYINSKHKVHLKAEHIELESDTMAVNVGQTTWNGNISHTGNYTMTGQARFNGVLFDTHKHVGVTPGNGISGVVTA
ncbi:Gp138 family membrane-puncturing spike protein [Streptomyces microflavus]|uniref:Gp138 family membrane-puncturing spike protein n=1 Tax=Streptomyces microflavus TaxID=1919 RepID=UPI00362DF24E